jgi:DNA-binding transcriptional regulator YdaS (Cro superfamily)
MTLNDFFYNLHIGAKKEMCESLGITQTWLSLILNGSKKPSPQLCLRIEEYTKNKVKAEMLRPDIFRRK